MLEYRILDSLADLERVCDLEILVWNIDPREAVPASVMHIIVLNGGVVIGAYEVDQLVGMAFAFPVRRGKKWLLWSHMTGVVPDFQGRGIGFALKQVQREWALEHGYATISWTFDPLQKGNANFNLHLLGAVTNCYHVDFYGEMQGINAGLPSDRVEVVWNLRDSRVKSLARGSVVSHPEYFEAPALLTCNAQGHVSSNEIHHSDLSFYLAEIPFNLSQLKQISPTVASEWRVALRETLQRSFAAGYSLVDFVESDERCWYVLSAPENWYLYVVLCSDESLYTGITPDLERRLSQHNAGHGAVYTATRRPVYMLAAWRFASRSAALKAEAKFKQLTRQVKLKHINQQQSFHDAPFVQTHTPDS